MTRAAAAAILPEPGLARQRARIAPQTGAGFELGKGELLRVIDPQGEQVADLMAFSHADPREVLSSGRSIDYANTIYLTTGHTLYSNRSVPMFCYPARRSRPARLSVHPVQQRDI